MEPHFPAFSGVNWSQIHAEVRPDLAARVDVADEFLERGRRAAAPGGSGCTRSACSTPPCGSARAAPARRACRAAPACRACRAAQAGAGARAAPVVPPRPAAPPCPATPIVPAAPDAPAAPASPPSPAEPMGTPPHRRCRPRRSHLRPRFLPCRSRPPPTPRSAGRPTAASGAARGECFIGHAGNEKHRRQPEGGGMTRSCHARLKHRPLLSLRSLIPPVPVDVE